MARRTNYGFAKKQRQLKKQLKKQEKAERRSEEEATGSAPEPGAAGDEAPPESGPRDDG